MAETQTTSQDAHSTRRVRLTVSKDSMSATVVLRQPRPDEPMITGEEFNEELKSAGIVYGLDKSVIETAVKERTYNHPIRIAVGKKPERGAAAKFDYKFDTTQDHKPQEDKHGKIDYKNIQFIQNINDGDVLALKIPAQPGMAGMNIFGKEIQGPIGRDVLFKYGTNTRVSEDGLSLYASASGAIVYLNGRISVNDVTVINSDIDYSVGNIDSRGSVRITGNVKSGFSIKTDGDLEVNGNIEDCDIEVKGNIMVKGGMIGKGNGKIIAKGDISAKFIEGQKIVTEGSLLVGDEIVNSDITAAEKVQVKSRQGRIVGGDVRAGKEIRAANLGSEAGTATKLTVSYDSKLMARYHSTIKELTRLKEDEARVKDALYGLYRLQVDGKLNEQQEAALKKFEDFKKDLPSTIETLEKQRLEIEEEMKKLQDSVIVAEDVLFSGVKAYFGIVYREILEDKSACTLSLEAGQILMSEYRR